jgi:hypothetical protein
MFGNSKLVVSRWYLDCIAPDGDFFIGQAVSIRWSKLHINLVSGVTGLSDRINRRDTIVFREAFPQEVGPELTWNCAPLSIRGTWDSLAPKFEQALYSDKHQLIQWRCIAPRARVSLQLGDSRTLNGVGYADYIQVTADKWTLPIRELRFGRYLTDRESFIWIDMAGAFARPWVWRNGIEQPIASITDDLVAIEDNHTLGLAHKKIVREGTLGDTILQSLPALRTLIPKDIAALFECTWRTRAVLLESTEEVDTGWAIHQLIRFPK